MPVKEKKLTGKQIARVLEKARKLMNDNGKHWKKEEYECRLNDGSYAYCARGAIRKSMLTLYPAHVKDHKYYDDHLLGEEPVLKALRKFTTKGKKIETWNDSERRTWEQVDAAFRKAAELARES